MKVKLVGSYGLLNPAHVIAHFGVDARLAFESTAVAPGDNALEFSIADHGAARVTLSERDMTVRTLSYAQMGETLKTVPLLSRGHLPRLLILCEAPSLPWEISLHTTPLVFLFPPHSSSFLLCGPVGSRKSEDQAWYCHPASPAPLSKCPSTTYLLRSVPGCTVCTPSSMYLFTLILTFNITKRKLIIYPTSIHHPL